MKRIAAVLLGLSLAACGGGGSAGAPPFGGGSGGGGGGGGTTTGSLSVGLSSTTVTAAAPATVTARVLDASGSGVAGRVVSFSTSRGLGVVSVDTALTDSSGRASVLLSPASPTSSGADEVVATINLAGADLQALQGFQVQATSVTVASFAASVGSSTLSAYGQTELTVMLAGASVGSPVNLALTSACAALGKATVTPLTLTATSGVATVQYKDNGCGALQASDRLTVSIVGSTQAPTALNLAIAAPTASSIAYVSAIPSTIYLKGSGLGESASVTFELRDAAGQPLPNQDVTLALVNSGADGLTLEGGTAPVVRRTSNTGQVSVRVNAGTIPTPVRVSATGPNGVVSVSTGLSVAVGLPSQLNFSLSQQTINIEGFNIDGTPNTYSVIVSDRSGNPVPDGTSINFVTEGGQVEPVKQTQTINGIARTPPANFVSAEPRPADGRVTIVAYALGEESFLDQNGNNVYDAGEPFQDLGHVFKDRAFDGLFDSVVDEYIPLSIVGAMSCSPIANALLALNPSIPTIASTCDGGWGRAYTRRATETVLSTSSSRPLWVPSTEPAVVGSPINLRTSPGSTTTTFYQVNNSQITNAGSRGRVSFLLSDSNAVRLNPVAAGTTVTASATTGLTVAVVGGSPVPSTPEANLLGLTYEFAATNPPPSGVVTVRITSPGGLTTVIGFDIVR